GAPRTPLPFDETLKMLHSSKEAASDQQMRLRKTELPADAMLQSPSTPPTVFLVGVGPGDVELLTLKALRVMGSADLVLYDRLISPEILSLVNPEAAMLYVGKESGLHTRPQEEIHELLLQFAMDGKTVCRLKGGDPTVFGRGGEEMEYLEAHGVSVAVVPGITAASGIAANLGVPLTHRDHADAVRFVTGHARSECTDDVQDRYSWQVLADPKCTLVIYMGLSTLPDLAKGLLGAGLPEDTPAVAVQDGTTPTQRVVAAQLGSLHDDVSAAGLRSPTLVIIGQVVSLLRERGASSAAEVLAQSTAEGGRTLELTAEDVAREIAELKGIRP
ncbi:MAG: hypothetical protein SGPRY_007670, partial [Prymnesium sp.]